MACINLIELGKPICFLTRDLPNEQLCKNSRTGQCSFINMTWLPDLRWKDISVLQWWWLQC